VKMWNGTEYSAILLAGSWVEGSARISAASVYVKIEVMRGIDDNMSNVDTMVASNSECEKVRALFANAILCCCKSFVSNTCVVSRTNTEVDKAKCHLQAKQKVFVPSSTLWRNNPKVRKISFTASGNSDNPAPDPALLLGKSASNWLKRENLTVLPGCCEDSSNSFDNTMTWSEELAFRGWTPEIPCDVEANFATGNTFVETLSDIED
jgi:hypothetical protein